MMMIQFSGWQTSKGEPA